MELVDEFTKIVPSTRDNFGKFIHQFQPEIKDTYLETSMNLNKII